MPGFRMPRQFLSFGAGDGLYGGSVFVWVNYESPFEWNAANVTGCFLVFARSAPVLIVTLQLSLKEFLTGELLRSSRSARHFSVTWDRPSDSNQVLCVLPMPFQRCASDAVRFVRHQALGESMTWTSWARLARQQLNHI
jgi:hypothetical protein